MAKNYKYKNELEAQLQERNKKAQLDWKVSHNPMEQKQLSDDYRKFEQKEQERINNGRLKTKNVMMQNQYNLQRKADEQNTLAQQDKDVFNRQALEDKLHAEKTAEERRRWRDWQREALKNDYEDQIKRKEQFQRMEREKEKDYASQYKHTVEKFEVDHDKKLEALRKRNEKVLEAQQRRVIPDLNESRKRFAMDSMKRQFETTEKKTLKSELDKLNKKHHAERETGDVLKMQMDIKKKHHQTLQKDDENYKKYVESTVNMLSARDRKIAEDKKKLRESYAKELEKQIKEHKDQQKVMYNEMDERSQALNQRGLMAYETCERNTELFKLPGVNREHMDRENYARYARKKSPSQAGIDMGLSHPLGDTMSYRSGNPLTNSNHIPTLPYNQQKYKEAPKTTTENGTFRGRRSSRGMPTPLYDNIRKEINQYKQEEKPQINPGISKYKSMAALEKPNEKFTPKQDNNDIDVINGRKSNMLSPRNQAEPEYEPTKRKEDEKRSLRHGVVSRSITSLGDYKGDKHSRINTGRHSNTDKLRNAPESLLNINSQLNKRILDTMRAGNLNISKDNVTYGKEGASTQRGYASALP